MYIISEFALAIPGDGRVTFSEPQCACPEDWRGCCSSQAPGVDCERGSSLAGEGPAPKVYTYLQLSISTPASRTFRFPQLKSLTEPRVIQRCVRTQVKISKQKFRI